MQAPLTQGTPSNIEAWAKWADFQTFGDPQLVTMVEAVASFVTDMKADKPPRFLSLLGTSGAGKTKLAKRVWRWFSKCGRYYNPIKGCDASMVRTGQFCDWRDLIESMMDTKDFSTMDLCQDCFLVLDDIGAKRDKSGFGADKLDTVLAARSERKWTLITSNLSVAELAAIDSRIASRLCRGGSVVVEVNVPDYSLRRKVQ